MSDAQWPPDSGAEVKIPLQRFGARLGSLGDGQVEDLPGHASSAIDGEAIEISVSIPAEDGHAAVVSEGAPDDTQENPELASPEVQQSASDEVIALPPMPPHPLDAAPPSEDRESEHLDTEPPSPSDADDVSSPAQHHASALASPRATESPLAVSPIFSALDAAEEAAEAEPPDHGPTLETADTGFPQPPFELIETKEDKPSAIAQPASDALGSDTCENDANLAGVTAHTTLDHPDAPQEFVPTPDAEQPPPPEALQGAAARIAAEADATAAALENLKRLLANKGAIPAVDVHEIGPERTEPPPIPIYRAPLQLPVTPPPMVPLAAASVSLFEDYAAPQHRRPAAAVGSFLAGFALSWVLGAVLYVYLTAG